MSACWKIATARALVCRARAKVSSTRSMAAAMRADSSASCSGVGAVLPRPVQGARSLLLPTTWMVAISTPRVRSHWFSGNPRSAWLSTFIGREPSVSPGVS